MKTFLVIVVIAALSALVTLFVWLVRAQNAMDEKRKAQGKPLYWL